jgi:hypothetical protein
MNRRTWIAVWLIALPWLSPQAGRGEGRSVDLMQELLADGVAISAEERVSVSSPKWDPQDPGANRAAVTARLAGPTGWDSFVRKSVVAPVRIDLDYLRAGDGSRQGQRIHVALVVHATLATLRDPEVMGRLLGGESQDSNRPEEFSCETIEPDALRELGIQENPSFASSLLRLTLLDKIEVRGVIRSQRIEGDNFFAIAWMLDERFTDRDPPDERYRNQWVKRGRDELGNATRSEPHPYRGAGGYLIVSDVEEIEGASLIEAEVVFHEPEAWFSGSNLLRSKLPLLFQESARRFRRELMK